MKSFKKKVVLGLAALALVMPFTNVLADGTVQFDTPKSTIDDQCGTETCSTSFKVTVQHDIEAGYSIGTVNATLTPKTATPEKITNVKVTLADGYTGENGETEITLGEGKSSYEFVIKSEENIPANQVVTVATISYDHPKEIDDCGMKLRTVSEVGGEHEVPVDPPKPDEPVKTGVSVPALVLGGTAIVALGVYAVTTKKSKIKNI